MISLNYLQLWEQPMSSSIVITEIFTTYYKNLLPFWARQKSKVFQKHFCQKVILNLQNIGHIANGCFLLDNRSVQFSKQNTIFEQQTQILTYNIRPQEKKQLKNEEQLVQPPLLLPKNRNPWAKSTIVPTINKTDADIFILL